MIKTLIFDNNGVLTTTEGNGIKTLADLFEVEESEFLGAWKKHALDVDDGSISSDQFLQNVIDHFDKKVDFNDLKKIYFTFYERDDEMHEIVKKLGEKYQIALLSNFGDSYLEFDKKWKNNETFGENVFVSAYLGIKKPEKEIYLHALKNLDAKAEESIFVDDRLENIDAAKSLGMKGILFKNPEQFLEKLENMVQAEKVNV